MKSLSIIIPAYNAEPFLDKAVSSLLTPEILNRIEIIVVNDGSVDRTAEIAQKYCDRYPDTVRLISQENKGHGGALNTGCAAAEGKYLKILDADGWFETQNLSAFVDAVYEGEKPPIDVYDTAAWMSITCLSEQSVAMGGAPVPVPDFTNGRWIDREETRRGIYCLDEVCDEAYPEILE
jgi:glycosyltransferase involved in cell wall biosynthesis